MGGLGLIGSFIGRVRGEKWTWVGFGGPYATRLLRKGFISPRTPVFKPRDEHALLDLFTGMIGEMRAERIGFAQILAATTSLMLAIVHAAARAGESIDTHAEKRNKGGALASAADSPGSVRKSTKCIVMSISRCSPSDAAEFSILHMKSLPSASMAIHCGTRGKCRAYASIREACKRISGDWRAVMRRIGGYHDQCRF